MSTYVCVLSLLGCVNFSTWFCFLDALFEFSKDATIDIQLPRRSLLVKFTCNLCGERTNRLVNRLAYERGLIYVQCAGCQKYHKLVDNLGLVVEYDLREDFDVDTNADEV
ncbi:unnamed protein product [Malus baccata var. baccata]